ncbi:MAG: YfcE family phosphodiesterase, partial [Candidatus Methanospirareceae archaeon]
VRILVIGDTHIPSRAPGIEERLVEKIREEEPDYVFCTGDLTDEKLISFYESIGKLYLVAGNMDYIDAKKEEKVEIKGIRIGLIHGDEIYPRGDVEKLSRIAKKLDVDILISGHTHKPMIKEKEVGGKEVLLLNPGSATGAWGGGGGTGIPSVMFLDIEEGKKVKIRLVQLKKGEIEEISYLKIFKISS